MVPRKSTAALRQRRYAAMAAGYDFEGFEAFAKGRMKSAALDVLSGAENVALFRDSLQSAIAHTRFQDALRSADGGVFHVVAGILDKMVPNAVADYLDGTHFMAMNTALFVAIQEFAMFCFTQQDFFPDVGDPSLEVSPKPLDNRAPGLWLLDFTRRGGRVQEDHGRQITPRGQSRHAASIYLGLLMARFVWLHEFQHCFNGHVRFVQDNGHALRLYEIPEDMSIVGFSKEEESEVSDIRAKRFNALSLMRISPPFGRVAGYS